MSWIALCELLTSGESRRVTDVPALSLGQVQQQALQLAGGLQRRNVRSLAVHLEDAAQLAIALLGAWRAGARVLLPADLQPANR
ncbi:MAG TPA: AMP-binding protein, partial [Pseudomonas sp.]|nr:AMP-binding protein [Pseudomonas sp.]